MASLCRPTADPMSLHTAASSQAAMIAWAKAVTMLMMLAIFWAVL